LVILLVIIKPLHAKLAHAFGCRLILSVSVHSQTWPVIVSVTKRALLGGSLPVPRCTADENSNQLLCSLPLVMETAVHQFIS